MCRFFAAPPVRVPERFRAVRRVAPSVDTHVARASLFSRLSGFAVLGLSVYGSLRLRRKTSGAGRSLSCGSVDEFSYVVSSLIQISERHLAHPPASMKQIPCQRSESFRRGCARNRVSTRICGLAALGALVVRPVQARLAESLHSAAPTRSTTAHTSHSDSTRHSMRNASMGSRLAARRAG